MSELREWFIYHNDDQSDVYDSFIPERGKPHIHAVDKKDYDAVVAKLKEFDEYYTFQTLEKVEKERDDLKQKLATAEADAQMYRQCLEANAGRDGTELLRQERAINRSLQCEE